MVERSQKDFWFRQLLGGAQGRQKSDWYRGEYKIWIKHRGLFDFRDLTQSSMTTQATMAESKRDCQCRGEWSGNLKNPSRSAIFHQVSYGWSVDLPRRKARQVSTRDLGGDFPVSWPQGLEVYCPSQQDSCVMFERNWSSGPSPWVSTSMASRRLVDLWKVSARPQHWRCLLAR